MKRSLSARFALVTTLTAVLLLSLVPGVRSATLQEQASPESEVALQVPLEQGVLPIAPAFVRLLRINLEPGAGSPLHTHPGPEIARIESGTLAVRVNGKALLWRATTDGTPAAETAGPAEAPTNEEFRMRRGDTLLYLPGTEMTFRNPGTRPTKILTVVVLPAGHQHPPGITYIGGQPTADAFKGVTPEILGDGIATTLPTGPALLTVERMKLGPGQAVPAFNGPVMISVSRGALDFTVVDGRVQVSRAANPGPQPEATPGTAFTLQQGDAAFFPLGMKEAPRSERDGEIVVLRLTIAPGEGEPTPTPAATGIGEIAISTPSAPAPTATSAPPATEEAEPTPTEQAGKFQVGDTVAVTEDGVNLRSEPSTSADIVTVLTAGQTLTITGSSVTADGYTWWPVQEVGDPSLTGYVAEDFLEKQ
jgi:quercetin dioxygenase-like cupin family protein